jgi:hypothetical protein
LGKVNKILIGTVLIALMLSTSLSVFAQTTIAKPPTPEFTVQFDSNSQEFVIKIKNIEYDLPSGYDIHYNIRANTDCYKYGSYSWGEAFIDYYPIQDPSGYTTIKMHPDYKTNGNRRFDCEVQALVCHYETEISYSLAHLGQEYTVTKVDSRSDWSSAQSLTVDINYPTNDPTFVWPDPDPTQTTTPYPQYTQNPTASPNQLANQFTALLNSHWEQLALLAMATIIVVLAVGLVLVWRKVGNLADQKQPQ